MNVATHPVAQLSFRVIPDAQSLQHPHRSRPPRTHTFHTIYDAAGRLVKVLDDSSNEIEEYFYGASRNRLKKETSTQKTYYAWGGNSPLVEYTEATASSTPAYAKSYVYAGSRLVLSAKRYSAWAETTSHHHPDRLGTRLMTDHASGSSSQQSTLPFGTGLGAETTGSSNQLFSSYDRSASTGLDYAVNRTYSQGQSRFTQVDPIGMAAVSIGNPQSNNLYGYVQNMPADFIDPLGLLLAITRCEREITILWSEDGKQIEQIIVSYSNCRTEFVPIGGGTISLPRNPTDDGRGGPIAPPYISQFPPVEGVPRRPPPPSTPRNPCGGTTDINGSVGFLTGGVRIGERAIVPYVGLFGGVPSVSGSMTFTPTPPSTNIELNSQLSFAPGLGVTRTTVLEPGGSFPESLARATANQLPGGNASNAVGAMSPTAGASITVPITSINLGNDSVLCR